MSWRRTLRTLEADARRHERRHEREQRASERESMRAMRALERQLKEYDKAEAREKAIMEAAAFENYLERIVSVHKDCGAAWKWAAFAAAPSPEPPPRTQESEARARRLEAAYQPGFFDRILGRDKKARAVLARKVQEATAADEREYQELFKAHEARLALWKERRSLGARICAGELPAYREGLDHVDPFEELASYDTKVRVAAIEAAAIALECEITDPEVVPAEEVKLTAAGKLSTKAMALGRYWALYQDYVCSCAIRVAREALAVLPVSRVVISIGASRLDTSTGHNGVVTFLTASFSREGIERLNLDAIDPSDSMKNFPHRMKFKKTAGFDSVDPMALDENWVSAG